MRKLTKFSLLPLIAMTMSAATINLNTGTAAWQVTQTAGTANSAAGIGTVGSSATGNAVTLTGTLPFAANLPGFESFAWANPFGGAVWIGQLATDGQFTNGGSITCGSPCGAEAGTYTYTFSFSAALGGSLVLNGFTGDNGIRSLTVSQSGGADLYNCTFNGSPGCAASQNSVTATTGTLTWSAAVNRMITITAVVVNDPGPGRNPSGMILSGTATTIDPPSNVIPEPSTYAMLGLGFAALAASKFRRK